MPDDVAALKAGIRNPESETTIQREKYLMVKYMNWGKKYGIKKKLKSLVGINENAVYKGSEVLPDRERQRTVERQRELYQTVQMADSPFKKRYVT